MSSRHYLVRAMTQSQEDFSVFFKNNVVAVGWSKIDFSSFSSSDELVSKVYCSYYENGSSSRSVVGKKKNEVRRFKEMKKGDRIVIPFPRSICLAESEEAEFYSHSAYEQDLSNQRSVTYHRDQNNKIIFIPRSKLSEGLQRRLKVRGTTISDLWEFGDEIDRLFDGQDFDSSYVSSHLDAIETFKIDLLNNIQSGNTGLESGGYGLEKLVRELLEIDGYSAEIQSKQRFSGFSDADIEAVKQDFVSSTRLFVQVKHHQGTTGCWGAKQLMKILDNDIFADHGLVLVTSALPSEELVDLCEAKDITLIQGNDLADWIYKSLGRLSFQTKKRLRISDVPTLLA